MSTDHEQTLRKLVYLRDHAPCAAERLRTERSRRRRRIRSWRGEAAWLPDAADRRRVDLDLLGAILSGAIRPEGEGIRAH
jgi:hypothetical protein